MRHLDLFSGIGGFALAVDAVWDNAEHIFCEINPYCRALLKLRFKGAKIYGDIRELTADTESQRRREEGKSFRSPKQWHSRIDLLTGGFPCQPFSQAGKRKGTSDNRYLWPEMLRVIREFQPTWVIAENVRGLLTISEGLVFEQVCLDLEGEGYEVQPFIIPAVAVNAPHRRDRVWFVAHSKDERMEGVSRAEQKFSEHRRPDKNTSDTALTRRAHRLSGQEPEARAGERGNEAPQRNEWERPWLEVATELCRVDDGLPAELDGLKLSKAGHRVERLKALGNAIVPQVAIEIMRAIALSEEVMAL